jgi:hypothetical protein
MQTELQSIVQQLHSTNAAIIALLTTTKMSRFDADTLSSILDSNKDSIECIEMMYPKDLKKVCSNTP